MKRRKDAGMNDIQSMAAFVHAYLGDFWIVVASTNDEDVSRLRNCILKAFEFLGWQLSKSKFKEEGFMKPEGVLIGHDIDLKSPPTRGVMDIKKCRIRAAYEPMLTDGKVSAQTLLETVGLCESVKGDTSVRWRMGPIYRMAHSTPPNPSSPDVVNTTYSAKRCIRKILNTLHLRQSLYQRPTRWIIPAEPTVEMVPNGDAAQQIGYAGVMLEGRTLKYFQGLWPQRLRDEKINIALLEAWTIVMTAATWGPSFNCKKVVFRTDSGASCYSLNRLWARSATMQGICDLWEDVQHKYAFEGLVLHCAGEDNRLSDRASRCRKPEDVDDALRNELDLLGFDEVEVGRQITNWEGGNINFDIFGIF
jgi:hypothetical protein